MRVFVKGSEIDEKHGKILIEYKSENFHHIVNVMRKKLEDKIDIVNMETKDVYKSEIIQIDEIGIFFNILSKEEGENIPVIKIYQALPKSDRLEYLLEKATEIGVSSFKLIEMERNVVHIEEKKVDKKLERWRKIIEAASKQSRRNDIPEITVLGKMKNVYEDLKKNDLNILLYEKEEKGKISEIIDKLKKEKKSKLKEVSIGIIVGPEGGITDEEYLKLKEMGAKSVLLGKRILRAETAGLVMASILQYELGELGE